MNYILRIGKAVTDRLSHLLVQLGEILVICLMLLISFGAVSRYAFGEAQGWVTEVSAYSMLVLAFLGAPKVLKEGKHIDIDIFVNMLKPGVKSLFKLVTSFVGSALCLVLFRAAVEVTIENYLEHAMLVGMVEIPKYLLFGIMPIGLLFLALYFARDVYRQIAVLFFATKG